MPRRPERHELRTVLGVRAEGVVIVDQPGNVDRFARRSQDCTHTKRPARKKWYYESGAVEETGEYKNDRKQGVWKRFYENGKTRVVENYKDKVN